MRLSLVEQINDDSSDYEFIIIDRNDPRRRVLKRIKRKHLGSVNRDETDKELLKRANEIFDSFASDIKNGDAKTYISKMIKTVEI